MPHQLNLNLPVADLQRSVAFFDALGYGLNPDFTDERAACVVLNEEADIHVMLLTHEFFATFADRPRSDPQTTTAIITALAVGSRQRVDELTDAAVGAGATEAGPARDLGFMYQRSFHDPDGHHWELFHMDAPPSDGQ